MRASVPAAVLVALSAGLLAPSSSPAKEHGAACAPLPAIIDRLRGALLLAAFHRGRGSSLAAYETLRTSAASVTDDRAAAGCGVVQGVLAQALSRAGEESTAMAASLQIDEGIAAALSVALTGSTAGPQAAAKLLDVTESVEYGGGCPDLFKLVRRLTLRSQQGGPPRPLPADQLPSQVADLLAELRPQHRCLAVTQLLGAAAQRERTEPRAMSNELAHAVDSLRLDEPDQSIDTQNPIARCPELPLVVERIAGAIAVGAPLYNKGDHAACRDLYRRVARAVRDDVIPAGRCPAARAELDAALTAAAQASDPGDAAWALRHGFDRITDRSQDTGK
jgi:hypothetical protein